MKIKYISLLIALLFAVSGCDLDRMPKGQISSGNYWKSQNDVELALMGCYSYIDASVYDAYVDGYADNNYCQYPWENNAPFISAGDINTDLNDGYNFEGIRRFNYFLDNAEKVTMDEKLLKQYMAEVKVLRAWRYFNMTNKFGPVPLFKISVTTKEEAAIAPTSEKDVISFVIGEIKEAIPALTADNSVKSRITKGAAQALLARICLNYGQWSEAAAAASEVMKMGYELFVAPDPTAEDMNKDDYSKFVAFKNDADKRAFYKGLASYEQLFWDANQSNSEVILNSEAIPEEYNYISLYLLPDNAGGGWSSITPTVELVNAYWKRDGNSFTPPTKEARATAYNKGDFTDEYLNEFRDRDTRLYATILFPGAVWKAMMGDDTFIWTKGGSNTSKTGYNYRKMVDPAYDVWHEEQDYPTIRYAEVLLTYAEAKNESSGPDKSVFDALNAIRRRVGMPDVAAGTGKEALREIIRNERRIELANEGFRWMDVRRWGISKEVMKNTYAIDGDLAQERRWEEKFMRLPYPQEAIDRNPNLKEAQAAKGY